MNRRTLLRAAGATSSLAVAGCLETETEPTDDSETDDGPTRYARPAYSSWPPDASHDGGGVVSYYLELGSLPAIQRAVSTGRLDSTQPVFGLPLSGVDRIATAVESLSSYPFEAALRQAVNAASGLDTETVVEPATEPIVPGAGSPTEEPTEEPTTGGNESHHTDESTDPDGDTVVTNETAVDDHTNETVVDGGSRNETAVDDHTNESNVTADTDTEIEPEPEPLTAAEVGIEVDAVTLTDELLVFEGSFDRAEIVDRFGAAFEQVDSHRGVAIYEGRDETAGLAFGLSGSRFLVPTENDARVTDGERLLAHVLSGYISTLNRVVDDSEGQWLYETTGSGALAVVVWELPNTSELLAETPLEAPSVDSEPVFGPLSSFSSVLSVTVDSQRLTAAEARFSGLFPDGPPATEELQSALAGEADSQTVFREPPRAHVTAEFSTL